MFKTLLSTRDPLELPLLDPRMHQLQVRSKDAPTPSMEAYKGLLYDELALNWFFDHVQECKLDPSMHQLQVRSKDAPTPTMEAYMGLLYDELALNWFFDHVQEVFN